MEEVILALLETTFVLFGSILMGWAAADTWHSFFEWLSSKKKQERNA